MKTYRSSKIFPLVIILVFDNDFNLANGFNMCASWVFPKEIFQKDLSLKLIPSLTIIDKNSTFSKSISEYFAHEWSHNELKNSVAFGTLKYTRNCIVNIIPWYSEQYVKNILSRILWDRLSRPAIDYFLFMPYEAINLQTSEILQKLSKRALLKCDAETCVVRSICSHGNRNEITEKCFDFVNGKHYEVAITFAAPLISFKKDAQGNIVGRGVQYKMLETAAQRFNHTFGIHVSIGRGTGSKLANGSCIGTSGEIFHGRADIGFPLGNSITRQQVMDATTVFEYTRLTFVYKSPSPQSKWEALFWCFPTNVWISISVTVLVLIPFVWLILVKDPNKKEAKDLKEAIHFVVEVFLEQDAPLMGKASKMSIAFRIIAFTWISASMILGTAYRSKLVSFLTFPFVEDVPNTFQKLADSNYKVNFKYYGGVAYEGFKNSNNPKFRKIFTRLNVEKDLYKCMESVVLEDKTVCVVYYEAALYMTANNFTLSASSSHSIIGIATEFGMLVPLVFAFRKGSPLTQFYNDIAGVFKSSGLHDEWMKKDFTERKKISVAWLNNPEAETRSGKVKREIESYFDNLDPSLKPLFLKNLVGPFALLGFGVAISFLLFISEIFKKNRKPWQC